MCIVLSYYRIYRKMNWKFDGENLNVNNLIQSRDKGALFDTLNGSVTRFGKIFNVFWQFYDGPIELSST